MICRIYSSFFSIKSREGRSIVAVLRRIASCYLKYSSTVVVKYGVDIILMLGLVVLLSCSLTAAAFCFEATRFALPVQTQSSTLNCLGTTCGLQ